MLTFNPRDIKYWRPQQVCEAVLMERYGNAAKPTKSNDKRGDISRESVKITYNFARMC